MSFKIIHKNVTDINEKHRPDEDFNMLPLLVELGLDVDSTAVLAPTP